MNAMIAGILILLTLLTLVLCVLAVRGLATEVRGPGEDGPDRTAGDKQLRREIEQWREGK